MSDFAEYDLTLIVHGQKHLDLSRSGADTLGVMLSYVLRWYSLDEAKPWEIRSATGALLSWYMTVSYVVKEFSQPLYISLPAGYGG